MFYSLWYQYKLNLRNKAGWQLHFAVHAYCAFSGWNYNTSSNPHTTPSVHKSSAQSRWKGKKKKKKHPGLSQIRGEQYR